MYLNIKGNKKSQSTIYYHSHPMISFHDPPDLKERTMTIIIYRPK
jgi:hypothetical protein